MGTGRSVVRLVAREDRNGAARRIRLRFGIGLPAGQVLARLLHRVAAERRAGRSVRMTRASSDVLRLLELCGLGDLLTR